MEEKISRGRGPKIYEIYHNLMPEIRTPNIEEEGLIFEREELKLFEKAAPGLAIIEVHPLQREITGEEPLPATKIRLRIRPTESRKSLDDFWQKVRELEEVKK